MNRHDIRYHYEHVLLPRWFFEQKEKLIGLVLHNNENLFRIIDDIFRGEGVENPYSASQFSVKAGRISEDIMLVRISFPEPEEAPLCYHSYLMFDTAFEKLGYYCVEKSDFGDPFLCSWTNEKHHSNYGPCTLDDGEIVIRCLKIFMEGA